MLSGLSHGIHTGKTRGVVLVLEGLQTGADTLCECVCVIDHQEVSVCRCVCVKDLAVEIMQVIPRMITNTVLCTTNPYMVVVVMAQQEGPAWTAAPRGNKGMPPRGSNRRPEQARLD